MTNVLILTGSVRKTRATDNIVAGVQAELSKRENLEVNTLDVRELDLPLFDGELVPSDENYTISNPKVEILSKAVTAADIVILLTPEYNAGLSAAQKNAIDWLHGEWQEKTVGVVGYGWSAAASARKHLSDVLARLNAREADTPAGLTFMKELNPDGSIADEAAFSEAVNATFDSVL